jgi:hypothetical protein
LSADNYLFVRKYRGKYYVEQQFASYDVDERIKPKGDPYATVQEAIDAAMVMEHEGYYEYGMRLSRSAYLDWRGCGFGR